MDFITGEKFQTLATMIFTSKQVASDDYSKLPNTFDIDKLSDLSIIYTHTMYIPELFFYLRKHENKDSKVIVISHNSDVNVHGIYKIPENVVKWYTTNVNCHDNRVESIPIGLENARWFKKEQKKEKMLAKMSERKKYRNLAYLNINPNTNPAERNPVISLLKDRSYVTYQQGSNGSNFDGYLDNVYNHKFVVCPEGNGMDTHRTWEALYMGVIPIEKRNLNNKFYTDLPICFVNNWNEVTKEFLNNEYDRITSQTWNLEKLSFEYWKNKITL